MPELNHVNVWPVAAVPAITVPAPSNPPPVAITNPSPSPAATLVRLGSIGPAGRDGTDPGVLTFIAGMELGGQRVVGLASNGTAILASAGNDGHFERVLGITEHAAFAGTPVTVRRVGEMTDPAWSFSVGPIWLGNEPGTLVQVAPDQGFLQQVAFADQPTRIFVSVGDPVQISPTL